MNLATNINQVKSSTLAISQFDGSARLSSDMAYEYDYDTHTSSDKLEFQDTLLIEIQNLSIYPPRLNV